MYSPPAAAHLCPRLVACLPSDCGPVTDCELGIPAKFPAIPWIPATPSPVGLILSLGEMNFSPCFLSLDTLSEQHSILLAFPCILYLLYNHSWIICYMNFPCVKWLHDFCLLLGPRLIHLSFDPSGPSRKQKLARETGENLKTIPVDLNQSVCIEQINSKGPIQLSFSTIK